MNWSSEWSTNIGNVWKGDFDGNPTVTLSIPIEGEWPRTVEAIQVGDLAVHEDLKFAEKQWQVTHVPTVTRFNVAPPGLYDKAALIEWCKKVQASNIEDWVELGKLDHSCYKERSASKDRIMNLCQNTPL